MSFDIQADKNQIGSVYLLHFLGGGIFHGSQARVRHYCGFALDPEARIALHMNGTSRARLMEVAHQRHVEFTVARIWSGVTREFERKLKNSGGLSRHCPICKAEGTDRDSVRKKQQAPAVQEVRVVEENEVKHIELIPRPKTAALTRDNARWNGKPFSLGAVSLLDGHIEEAHNYQECKAGGWHHSHIFSQPILEREQSEYDWTKTDPRAPEGPQGGGPAIGWGDTPWGDSHGKTSGDITIFWVEDDGSIGCNYPLPENIKAAIKKQIQVIRWRRAAEEDTLAKLVWQFREEQEDWYEWLEDKSCFREQCLCLADLLAKFLREHGFPDAHRAGGYYGEGPEKGEYLQVGRHGLHWWVETQDKIIDITCDQFHPGEEDDWRVVITDLNDPEYQRKGTGSALVPKTAEEIPEILYHVTFKSRVPKILQEGLVPQKEPNFPFEENRGLVFLTAIEGVDYWKNLIAEFIRGKDDELVTLRIKTEGMRLAKDPLGMGETGVLSYSTHLVPPKNITVLPEPRKIASVEQ